MWVKICGKCDALLLICWITVIQNLNKFGRLTFFSQKKFHSRYDQITLKLSHAMSQYAAIENCVTTRRHNRYLGKRTVYGGKTPVSLPAGWSLVNVSHQSLVYIMNCAVLL